MTSLVAHEREPRSRSYGVMVWNQLVRAVAAVAVAGATATAIEVIERYDFPTDDYPGLKAGIVIGAMARMALGAYNVSESYFQRRALQRHQTAVQETYVESSDDEFEGIVTQLTDPRD